MSSERRRPNILILTTDQHHPGCFGYAGHPVLRTPNIDALSERSVNFTRTYVANPWCTPSRASMFTGLHTSGHRVRMNGVPMAYDVPTFTEALRLAGYNTHCVGKIHLRTSLTPKGVPIEEVDSREFPEARAMWRAGRMVKLPQPYYGFANCDFEMQHGPWAWGEWVHWLEREHPKEAHLYHDEVKLEPPTEAAGLYVGSFKWAMPGELHPISWAADRAVDFLNRITARSVPPGDFEPFLLWWSTEAPHVPMAPSPPYCYHYDPKDVPPPVRQDGELERLPPHFRDLYLRKGQPIDPYRPESAAHYYGLIEHIDDAVGRILEALRENGLEENTVVLFTADHGEALGDHFMWGKGPFHFDGVVRVPLLISWPGHFGAGQTHDGIVSLVDMAPTLLDIAGVPIPEGTVPAEPVSPQAPPPWPGRSLLPILKGEEKGTSGTALIEDDEDGLGTRLRTLVTERYRITLYSGRPYGELFDFQEDPHELRNVWDDPAYESVRDDLKLALLDKMMEAAYPLPLRMVGA